MKILSFAYEDKARQWQLMPVTFGQLTLLVGASGVGKTQILRALHNLVKISRGDALNGVKWRLEFTTAPGEYYLWEGEFEQQDSGPDFLSSNNGSDKKNPPKVIWETITHNEKRIVERDKQDIIFNEQKTVRLPQTKSVINLLQEEDKIGIINRHIALIVLTDTIKPPGQLVYRDLGIQIDKFPSLKKIRNSAESIRTKLYLCSIIAPHIFELIKQRFIEVFTFVEDVRVYAKELYLTANSDPTKSPLGIYPFIQVKERGVDSWIEEAYISSGMYRTLLQISELYLCAEGTVFLIDEFENSLGVNCLDDLMNVMLTYERNLQFIITSHHPYIINNISYENWKIVTRLGGVVTVQDATEFNLGRSKHQAFTQLVNLDEYIEGVAA